MADIFDFYVLDNRKINFEIAEPIMREDKGVTDWVFHIPKILNGIDMSTWAWWLVYTNAKNQKHKEALVLSDDPESPLDSSVGTYTVDYGMSIKAGSVQFALEAINAVVPGGEISGEWHTLTYKTTVRETLQGSEVEIEESQSDIISALIQQIQQKYNALVGGATPLPANLKSLMTDHDKVYLYTGSEAGESTGYWYYWNGTDFVPGGVYGAGVQIDPTLSQSGEAADAKVVGGKIGNIENLNTDNKSSLVSAINEVNDHFLDGIEDAVGDWLDEHPEATTTVQDGSLTREKFSSALRNDIAFKDEYKIVVVSSAERAMCTALVDNTGNAILFDLSDETNGLKVVSDLNDAGVTNVVAVVISHYHHDHLGDYATIFGTNGISHDNVLFFIPDAPVQSHTSAAMVASYTAFIEWLEAKSIAYRTPTENETVNINGVNLTFNNVDASYWYNNYTPETFNYNWTSMCTYAEFASVSMQCMGDLYTDGLDYFIDVLNATRKATILNAIHHGLTIYINGKFIESCSPEVVINNYGTNNSYLNERNYATLIENYCNKTGIPVFDTADNDTFEILVSNGLLKYKDLTPLILKNEIITYPSYRDAFVFDNTGISVGQDMGIKTLLKGMPVNSTIKCRLGSAYQIYKDLIGSFGNYAVFEVSKIIGGSTNYLVNRTNPNDFWFEIKVTPFFEIVSETLNYFGCYDSINDTFHISKNKTVPMVFARMNLTKSSETDTTYSLDNASGTYQIGDLIHLDTNSFTVDRTGIYEVTITGNNVGTSDSITLNGWKYNIDNGESASFTQPLSSGTPYQFGSTNSTSKRSMFATIKFLGSNIKPLFPE